MSNLKDFRIVYGSMKGHVIPSSNAAYDFGSAEFKVRHLFLSDNSVWVGDISYIEKDGKSRKRRKKQHTVSAAAPGNPYTLKALLNSANAPEQTKFHDRFSAMTVGAELEISDVSDPANLKGEYTLASYVAESGSTPAYVTLTPKNVGVDDAVNLGLELQINEVTNMVEEDAAGNVMLSGTASKVQFGAANRSLSSDGDGDLTWNGAKVGGATTFSALTDTTISSPAGAQIPVYNGSASALENQTVSKDASLASNGDLTISATSAFQQKGLYINAKLEDDIAANEPVMIAGYDATDLNAPVPKVKAIESASAQVVIGLAQESGTNGDVIKVLVHGVGKSRIVKAFGNIETGTALVIDSSNPEGLRVSGGSPVTTGTLAGFILEQVTGTGQSESLSSESYYVYIQPG